MAFSEVCRICLRVNVRMLILKKTGLQNLYKTLMNSFRDEDEEPIIVCFICHARLIRCRKLQQQAIESNAVLEQLLAGGSMVYISSIQPIKVQWGGFRQICQAPQSIPKPHEARDEIQFTQICHIDIRPVECDVENDCKDEIFSFDYIKVEEENFENENSKLEENVNYEQHVVPANNFSKPPERKIKSKSTYSNINDVHKGNLDLESNTIKSNAKVKEDNQPINKKGKDPAKIMKKKILKQESVNTLTQKTSGTSTKYSFECDDCSKKFLTKDILAKHISYSHKTIKNSDTNAVWTQVEQTPVPQLTEIFNCDICEFKTSQKRCILSHLKAHVAEQVYCYNSNYKCTNKYHLQYNTKVQTEEKPFSCNICEYKCIKKSSMRKHTKIHTGEKPFSCNICKYKCIRKYYLQTHMKLHTGEKLFSCNICEYKCIRKYHLQTHMKLHTVEKPFSCNICGYKCINKSSMRIHMRVHTGEKPFSCNICKYKCIIKGNLQRHMKTHARKKPFFCNICEYKCIRKNQFQTHMKIHAPEKPFSCNICEYKCIIKSNLQRHMKMHTADKTYSCNICEYRCIRKCHLKTHMKLHTEDKPYSCHICDFRCNTLRSFKSHMKIHTGAKPFS